MASTDGNVDEPRAERPDDLPEASGEEPRPDPHAEVSITFGEYEELKTLARERDEYLRRLQRAVADYQNLQKRTGKIREALHHEAVQSATQSMLPVADALARALGAARSTGGAEGIVEGLELVEQEYYAALAKFDVLPIDAVGRRFDPHYHEAVMQEEADGAEPLTVVRELKKGFTAGGTVVRASQVTVTPPETPAPESSPGG